MKQITLNHGFCKTPGQKITHTPKRRPHTLSGDKSRTVRFPWSENHATNHANHGELFTHGSLPYREREPYAGEKAR